MPSQIPVSSFQLSHVLFLISMCVLNGHLELLFNFILKMIFVVYLNKLLTVNDILFIDLLCN